MYNMHEIMHKNTKSKRFTKITLDKKCKSCTILKILFLHFYENQIQHTKKGFSTDDIAR